MPLVSAKLPFNSRPLHTQDWEPVTITLHALSLMEKVEPVQVHFTLCLRDQQSMWMQDECKVYMDSHMASNESCFMVTWIIIKDHLLEVGNGSLKRSENMSRFHFPSRWFSSKKNLNVMHNFSFPSTIFSHPHSLYVSGSGTCYGCASSFYLQVDTWMHSNLYFSFIKLYLIICVRSNHSAAWTCSSSAVLKPIEYLKQY